MALTYSEKGALGSYAPEFNLLGTDGVHHSLRDFRNARVLVVVFMCNHCPYVKHLLEGVVDMAEAFLPQGIGFVGISANDPTDYPDDGPEGLREMAAAHEIPFQILFDETQEIARAFTAICTPDFFVFDADAKLFYHGRFDGSTHKNGIPMTGEDLKEALEAVLKGGVPSCSSLPSLGCSIKWKLS